MALDLIDHIKNASCSVTTERKKINFLVQTQMRMQASGNLHF